MRLITVADYFLLHLIAAANMISMVSGKRGEKQKQRVRGHETIETSSNNKALRVLKGEDTSYDITCSSENTNPNVGAIYYDAINEYYDENCVPQICGNATTLSPITGNVVLDQDYECVPGQWGVFVSDGGTLDCNGHTIKCVGDCFTDISATSLVSGIAFFGSPTGNKGGTIKNCIVEGFNVGISGVDHKDLTIENVKVTSNQIGLLIESGANAALRKVSAIHNKQGIVVTEFLTNAYFPGPAISVMEDVFACGNFGFYLDPLLSDIYIETSEMVDKFSGDLACTLCGSADEEDIDYDDKRICDSQCDAGKLWCTS